MELNDHLREMLKELGKAINESISGSDRVHESIQRIRDEGYNLYMVLDAKVGVKRESRSGRRRVGGSAATRAKAAGEASLEPDETYVEERAAFRINVKDLRILKALGIDPTRKVRSRPAPRRRLAAPPRRAVRAD